jgi:hypothetical protein
VSTTSRTAISRTTDRIRPRTGFLYLLCAPYEKPAVLRGDANRGNEPIMQEAEQRRQPYLFKLRLTKGVKRVIV